MSWFGVVTGMRAEARCLRGLEVAIACSGADGARARAGAARLVAGGARALLSFGLAAGLAPDLRPGDLILADAVILPDGRRLATDPAWRARVAGRLAGSGIRPRAGGIAGTDRLLWTPQMKRALHAATAALAADMESHAVAAVATGAGLPWLALRAVSDPVDQPLPRSVGQALTADGRVSILTAGRALLARPTDLPDLLKVGLQTRRALLALRAARPALGW